MPAAALRQGNRAWFTDRRAPDRRLQVTWHGDEQTTVFSIWHGDACAATFQLPVEDNARLIGQLVDALSSGATGPAPMPASPTWWTRVRSGFDRTTADILPFRRK